MDIAFFGSSLVSSWWNGAATYYRGLVAALAARGHRVTFYEPDAWDRQAHRDIPDPPWARVVVWRAEDDEARAQVASARNADVVVKASGVGILDDVLEEAVASLAGTGPVVAFLDVDAPATLERLERDPADPFHACVPRYDMILTYGGGPPVVEAYRRVGARHCVPVYNALDPLTHHPVPPDPAFAADLLFLGNRLPDRDTRVEEFLLVPAEQLPHRRFLLGGNGWEGRPLPPNVRRLGHVPTALHNVLNASALAVLNVCRDSMARNGWSPATRVFEAAGAAACIISDAWEGLDAFLAPDREVLVAPDGRDVARHLEQLDPTRARRIGAAARRRVLAEHTYDLRAIQLEEVLAATPGLAGRGIA